MEAIAITGLGAVTPVGCSQEAIFSSLSSACCGLHPCVDNSMRGEWFGSVPRDFLPEPFEGLRTDDYLCIQTDPALAYGLAAARGALEQSGLSISQGNRGRIGVFIGSSKGQLRNFESACELAASGLRCGPDDKRLAALFRGFLGEYPGVLTGRMLDLSGPVLNFPAACATGLVSLFAAAEMLRDGRIDAALAGSTESGGIASTAASFENMGALSRDRMRPFHRHRNGFNLGEGAAVFMCEREADARRRGAPILARLLGWDWRSDAYHMTAVEPHGYVIEHSIREAIRRAGWQPGDVDYVSAHGTATKLNDRTEAAALMRVFGSPGPRVSALKSWIGHLLGASGSVELALALVSAVRSLLPGTLLLDDPDPYIRLNFVPLEGARVDVRQMLKLSYGFGGHVAVAAVEVLGRASCP